MPITQQARQEFAMKNMMAALLVSTLALSACGKGDSSDAPTGQVVATVNGKEITNAELTNELSSGMPQDPALQSIISRYILADEAKKEGLDKLPETAILKNKAEQAVLIEMLTRKLRENVPAPSQDEVRQYVSEHPSKFDQRRIFIVDQLAVDEVSPQLMEALKPLDTLAQITQMLDAKKIQYRASLGSIDAMTLNADMADKLANMSVGEVFAAPVGNTTRVNSIREIIVKPLSQADAEKVAKATITTERTQKLVSERLAGIVKKGMEQVKINPSFAPKQTEQGKAPQKQDGAKQAGTDQTKP